jgi:hypothetical protein
VFSLNSAGQQAEVQRFLMQAQQEAQVQVSLLYKGSLKSMFEIYGGLG